MTSNFSAKITFEAKERTKAIFDSINTDNIFYPENTTTTKIKFKDNMEIVIESNNLAHLRANLNSSLRLIQASYDIIESANKK